MPADGRILSNDRALWLSRQILPHEPALRGWLSSRRLPGLEIDDVIQDTYARLIFAENVELIRNTRAYMFQTAWSVLMTHVRREKVVAIQAMADVDELSLAADLPSPEQHAADREELLRLAEAIAGLPNRIGEVFRLRRVQGLSQKEVARALGLAESTVEKHMKRGLMLLLQRFTRGGYRLPETSRHADEDIQPSHGQADRNRDR